VSAITKAMKARARELSELIREAFIGVTLTRSDVRLLQGEVYEKSLRALSEAVAAERELCAKIAEQYGETFAYPATVSHCRVGIAKAIRSRKDRR
jgi:hypothetical protein